MEWQQVFNGLSTDYQRIASRHNKDTCHIKHEHIYTCELLYNSPNTTVIAITGQARFSILPQLTDPVTSIYSINYTTCVKNGLTAILKLSPTLARSDLIIGPTSAQVRPTLYIRPNHRSDQTIGPTNSRSDQLQVRPSLGPTRSQVRPDFHT